MARRWLPWAASAGLGMPNWAAAVAELQLVPSWLPQAASAVLHLPGFQIGSFANGSLYSSATCPASRCGDDCSRVAWWQMAFSAGCGENACRIPVGLHLHGCAARYVFIARVHLPGALHGSCRPKAADSMLQRHCHALRGDLSSAGRQQAGASALHALLAVSTGLCRLRHRIMWSGQCHVRAGTCQPLVIALTDPCRANWSRSAGRSWWSRGGS